MDHQRRGWNSGSASIIDVMRNVWPVIGNLGWPTLLLVVATIPGLLLAAAAVPPGVLAVFSALDLEGTVAPTIAIFAAILALALFCAAFQAGLLAFGRRLVLENESVGFVTIASGALARVPAVFFAVVFVLLFQSVVVCFPGAMIVLFSPVFYLAGTRSDLSFVEAFWEGYGWIKTHIMTICGAAAGSFLAAFGLFAAVGFLVIDTMDLSGLQGRSIHQVVMAFLLVIWDLLYFLVITSLLYTIDAEESGLVIE